MKPRPTCRACGRTFQPKSRIALAKAKHCSRACYGKTCELDTARLERLRWIGKLGRAGWTAASRASYLRNMSGALNPAWKGGVTLKRAKGNYSGVRYVRCPLEFLPMARGDGYIMEHRLVAAKALGRLLTRAEVVHHKDHNPSNNAPENLEVFASNGEHKRAEAAVLRA